MFDPGNGAILLVCDDEERTRDILARLFDEGYSVVGPATTASLALALTAQTGPSLALIARPPTGRRGALELAQELMRTWGVRSVVLDDAYDRPEKATSNVFWAPAEDQLNQMHRVLGVPGEDAVAGA